MPGTGSEAERGGSPLDTTAGGTASQVPAPAVDALPVPTLPPWLAMLQPATAPGDAGTETTASGGDDAGRPTASCGTGVAAAKAAAAVKADALAQHMAAADDPLAGATAGSGRFAQALDEQPVAAQASAQPVAAGRDAVASIAAAAAQASAQPVAAGRDVVASIAAAFAPNPATGFSPTPPVAVALAMPVTAPAFAQELGVRISVLARDGVQHAELHLNPPDMGPVSVQIVLDGAQAQVDFGADVAATRAALEASLPALASALRDAGFTLTGGGVSQHSRNRGDGSGAAGGSEGKPGRTARHRAEGSAADEAIGGVRRSGRRTVSTGGLDLYA